MQQRTVGSLDNLGELDAEWNPIRTEVVDVGGRSIQTYRVDGDPSVPVADREPQLLIHGLGGAAVNWFDVLVPLSARGSVLAVDLPGFGRSPVEEGSRYDIDSYVRLVFALADEVGWDRFTLHGNSMGGLISTLVAAEQPERVSRLILVSPAFPPTNPLRFLPVPYTTVRGLAPLAVPAMPALEQWRNRELLKLIFADPDSPRPALLWAMEEAVTPVDEHEVSDRRRALREASSSITRLWLSPRRVWRAIDQVEAPTLLLGGTRDALIPARVLRSVLAHRTDWDGAVIDDHRHALMMDRPTEYLQRLDEWHHSAARAA